MDLSCPMQGGRRTNIQWEDDETELLIDGVEKHGEGRWKLMQKENRDTEGRMKLWRTAVRADHQRMPQLSETCAEL